MILCPHCQASNKNGQLFCEECGRRLLSVDSSPTLPTRRVDDVADGAMLRPTWGTARFSPDSSVVLHIKDHPDPVTIQPRDQVLLGRADVSSTVTPDFDFTPFGALEKGVSRLHAAIFRSEDTLMLVDKGSVNGTYLNGQRLIPHQPRVLRNGDEIRFGKMIAHIYFRPKND